MINNSKAPSELPPEELPQVTAFQDEFTRQFMDSTEEIEEGFYLMRSGINGYTMLFPEDGRIADKFYSAPGNHFEEILYGGGAGNETYSVDIKYQHDAYVEIVDGQLERIRRFLQYEGDFEEIALEDKVIYLGYREKTNEHENETVYHYFGYIKSNFSPQGIEFHYISTCFDINQPCNIDLEEVEYTAKMLAKSISFISVIDKKNKY